MSITDDGKTVCNQYNGEGLRIQKSVDGVSTNYLYEGMKVVAEYDKNYQLNAQNVQGNNLLMRLEKNAKYYYMYNGHADVTALLNAKTGNVDATYYYDAFGNILSKTGNVSNSYLYAGYQYDEETGLYYLNARMYDSETARFIQEDTYRGNPNDPLSLNLYTYCENNPLIYNDPTGHWPEFVNKAVKTVKQAVKKVTTKVVSSISKATSTASKLVSSIGKGATKVVKNVSGNITTSNSKENKNYSSDNSKKSISIKDITSISKISNSSIGLVAKEVVSGISDTAIGSYIGSLSEVSTKNIKMPKFGPAMQVETTVTRTGVKAIKGVSKIAGPVAVASYAYDVYQDANRYDGKDAVIAIGATTVAVGVSVLMGVAIATTTLPTTVAFGVGVMGSVAIGYGVDRLKDKVLN